MKQTFEWILGLEISVKKIATNILLFYNTFHLSVFDNYQ